MGMDGARETAEGLMTDALRLTRALSAFNGEPAVALRKDQQGCWVAFVIVIDDGSDIYMTSDSAVGLDPEHALGMLVEGMRGDLTDKINRALEQAERYKAALDGRKND